jgi:Ser/Thr protein kinase RdoA (MazF antagonist)
MKHDLRPVVEHFPIPGRYLGGEPYGTGHINDTYVTRWDMRGRTVQWIQQRINHRVFPEPLKIMENIGRVTRHLRDRLARIPGSDPDRETLTVIPTREGNPCFVDGDGNHWRTYVFINDAKTYDVCESLSQAFQVARAFARFQHLLADLPGGRLHETIPYFHHTPRRLRALEEALSRDAFNRAASAKPELEFVLARRPMVSVITDLSETGEVPERIAHNDTKLNNVMIDDRTGEGVCVIDLDTVMSGTVLYDFGDMVRTATRSCPEDEQNLDRVQFRADMFEALVRGYLESAAVFLTPAEMSLLAFSSRLVTLTIGIRFLTDYLMGDVYFKTHRPGQNLDRARVQLRMVANMEREAEAMEAVVERFATLARQNTKRASAPGRGPAQE